MPTDSSSEIGQIAERYNQVMNTLEGAMSRADAIVRSSMDGMITFSRDALSISSLNPAAEQIFGYSALELAGKPITRLLGLPLESLNLTDTQYARRKFTELLDTEGNDEMVGRRANGTMFPMEVQVTHAQTGGSVFYTATFRDITERKEAENALRRNEERFRLLIQNSSDMITIIDPNGTIKYQSPSAENLLGYDAKSMLGESIFAYIHPEDSPIFVEHFSRIIRMPDDDIRIEFRFLSSDSSWRVLQAVCNNQLDTPTIDGIVLNSRDFTQQRAAETALQETETRFRDLFEHSPDAIFVEDLEGNVLDANLAACALHRYERDELIGKNVRDLVPPELREQVDHEFRMITNREVSGVSESYSFTKDGSSIPVEIRASQIDYGGTFALLLHVRDITERKMVEAALRENEVKYRTIIENIEEGYYEVDLRGNLMFFNDALVTILGYNSIELVGMNNRDFMDERNAQKVRAIYGRVYQTGEPSPTIDVEVIRKDGAHRTLEISASFITDNNDKPLGFRGLAHDITERKRAEEELRQRNEYLAALHETALTLMHRLDIGGLLQNIIKRATQLAGAEHGYVYLLDAITEQLELKTAIGMLSDRVGLRINKGDGLVGKVWQSGETKVVDDYPNWSGRAPEPAFDVITSTVAVPLKHSDEVVGVIGVAHTESGLGFDEPHVELLTRFSELAAIALDNAQLLSAAQNSEANIGAVIENTRDWIWSIDNDFRVVTYNTTAKLVFQAIYGKSLTIGKSIFEVLPQDVHNEWRARYERALIDERFVVEDHFEFPGAAIEIEISLNPIISSDGQITGVSCMARDISERNQFVRDLRAAKEEAEAANRAKSVFLANMSHELRTPLNAIIGYSEMLEEDARENGQDEFVPDLAKIQAAGNHLLDLINNILDLSKIEAGRMELYLETFKIKDMLEDVVATIAPAVDKNNNILEIQITEGVDDFHADITKVRQTLFNLLSNAAKFTQDGIVTVTVWKTHEEGRDWILFEVRDTGIGMTPEQMTAVFKEFTQADPSTTRKYGGTGLGLTISRRFCQMMGGDITVDSEIDEGTVFSVILPLEIEPRVDDSRITREITQIPARLRPVRRVPSGGLVLVVDDDPSVRDVVSRSLSREGFSVEIATNGEEGLQKARELQPDAITLDVMMEGMDGWSVLSLLKADPELADIPVVMITIVDDRSKGFALGAVGYLTKPVDRKALVGILQKYQKAESPIRGRILVVEDDNPTREVMARLLLKENWIVDEAENGLIGLERIAENRPDLILLDLMMPEMDGFQFISQLQDMPERRSIPVIVVTAKDLTQEERDRLHGSVEHVLEKQIDSRDDLLDRISKLVSVQIERRDAKDTEEA
jgi:PAS domain S-box-containing protein